MTGFMWKPASQLDLHLIVDNYSTHKQQRVTTWVDKHPRFHLHLTPTGCSWLNLVECWFRQLTAKRIRCGDFHSVSDLIAAIQDYLAHHNHQPNYTLPQPQEEELCDLA